MRKLILGVIFCTPLFAFANTKPVDKIDVTFLCYDTDKLFKTLNAEYQEFPFLIGDSDDIAKSMMTLWISKNGETWTLITSKDETSCVVGAGKNLKLLRYGKPV